MDDLTITRLCARAADVQVTTKPKVFSDGEYCIAKSGGTYDPLNDYWQALKLVERLQLYVTPHSVQGAPMWTVGLCDEPGGYTVTDPNLLRAICLCAARAQQSRESQK